MSKKITTQSLHKLHIIAASLYGLMTIAILFLSQPVSVPVTTSYLTVDSLASSNGKQVLVTATRHLFDIKVAALVAAVLVIAGLTHLALAFRWRKTYEANLAKRLNPVRWIGWGTATALSVTTLAMLSGVSDKGTLLMIFGLVALTFYTNHVHETYANQAKQFNKFAFLLSDIMYLAPWFVIGFYAKDAIFFGQTHVPYYLYIPFFTHFVIMGAMLILMRLSIVKRDKAPFKDYLFVERNYIFGSFIRHSSLALAVFFGILK